MFIKNHSLTRRSFVAGAASAAASCALSQSPAAADHHDDGVALIAITLDLEMSRNFPSWEDRQWDYQKGNLTDEVKKYTLDACRRVKDRGGVIHSFAVGRVLEHPSVDWLKGIAADGHPIGNHTYDHVYVLAKELDNLQFRFQRAPWLVDGMEVEDVIRQNILMTREGLKQRVGIEEAGFRTPGGFAGGLHDHENIQKLFLDLGYKWVSCTYPGFRGVQDISRGGDPPPDDLYNTIVGVQKDAQPFTYPSGLIDIPMSPISDIGAFRNGRWKLDYFLKAVRLAVEWTIENGAVFDLLTHPSCIGVVDPEFRTFDLVCDLVEQAGDRAKIVDLDALAERATNE